MPTPPAPAKRPILHTLPVIGWIARDLTDDPDSFWYALVIALTLLVIGVMLWGVVVLTLVALAAVPVMFVILILIMRG